METVDVLVAVACLGVFVAEDVLVSEELICRDAEDVIVPETIACRGVGAAVMVIEY